MFFSKKGGLEWDNLLPVLIGVIFLIIMFFAIKNYISDDYNSSVFECNFFMKNLDGSPNYFGSGLDEVGYRFTSALADLCPSKEVEVEDDNLEELAKVVNGCYSQMGGGVDYYGANVENRSVCFQCGLMRVTGDVDEFNSKFYEVLSDGKYEKLWSEDTELINLNMVSLDEKNLPSSLTEDDLYLVLYYSRKPDLGNINDDVSSFVGKHFSSVAAYFLSDKNTGGFSGVMLHKWDENIEFKTDKKVNFFDSSSTKINCDDVIISNRNYD